jgi:glyoxylase-like metal-dependent hydrolase (beta-lactamase superfamily II)
MKLRAGSLALLFAATASPETMAQTKIEAQKLADGVWAAQPERGANVGWFVFGGSVVAVDAGADAAVGREILRKIAETAGKPVRHLILTHVHSDHSGGARAFLAAGAEVICHENAAGAVLGFLSQPAADPADPLTGKPNIRPSVVAVADRMGLFDGSRRVGIQWLGPAHTRGDLVVLLAEEKILFAGDIALTRRLPFMTSSDVDPRGWQEALQKLAGTPVEKMVPGHGEIGPRSGIADSFAYVKRINEIVDRLIENSVPDQYLDAKLREADYRIPNVPMSESHQANVKAALRLEKLRRQKLAGAPGPTPAPTRSPARPGR